MSSFCGWMPVGSALMQLKQEGKDEPPHPVAHASPQTNAAEAKYVPTELEVTALVYTVNNYIV